MSEKYQQTGKRPSSRRIHRRKRRPGYPNQELRRRLVLGSCGLFDCGDCRCAIEHNLEHLDQLTEDELRLLRETTDTLIENMERLKKQTKDAPGLQ